MALAVILRSGLKCLIGAAGGGRDTVFRKIYGFPRVVDLHRLQPIGSEVIVKGWVKAMRKMKESIFVDVSDGSCLKKLQVVIPKSHKPASLSYGAAIEASGTLMKNANEELELKANSVKVIGPCVVSDGYPFAPRKSYSQSYVRKFLHLRSRTNTFGALLRIRDIASKSIEEYLRNQGFINVHTPIITANDCEGAAEVFTVKPDNSALLDEMAKDELSLEEAYFDKKAFLTVSAQLHLEAIVRGLSRVYSFGPVFRAENSRSRLHLAEFYMLEVEAAFIMSLDELTKLMEETIKNITYNIWQTCKDDLEACSEDGFLKNIMEKQYEVMSYDKAQEILESHYKDFSNAFNKEAGLSKEHELFLTEHVGNIPLFITEWPMHTKPFYMKQCNTSLSKVAAVDLLVPRVGELCGGGLREDNYDILMNNLTRQQLKGSLDWYLELRKFGNVPTAGFGMGFERYLQMILGIFNIKDTIPFPRWPHNCQL